MIGINCGSGQRRFESTGDWQWINVDCVSRPPDQVPDLICDVGKERLPFEDDSIDQVAFVHCLEHFGCGEGDSIIKECHRILRPHGSLIVIVPEMREVVKGWLESKISDQIFFTVTYGAYQGQPGDRHAWGYTTETLKEFLWNCVPWRKLKLFDNRHIPGSSYPADWWMVGIEAVA